MKLDTRFSLNIRKIMQVLECLSDGSFKGKAELNVIRFRPSILYLDNSLVVLPGSLKYL